MIDAHVLPALLVPGRVVSEQIAANGFSAVVDVAFDCVVLLKVTYHPNWQVTIDGRPVQPVMLMPSYLGVPVSVGVHNLHFEYRAPDWRIWLMLPGALILSALEALQLLQSRRTTRSPADDAIQAPAALQGWSPLPGSVQVVIGLIALALLAGSPALQMQQMSGHDAFAMLPRHVEHLVALRSGVWWPRWAPDLAYGYGEPTFIFNPPIPYFVVSLLALLGVQMLSAINVSILAYLLLAAGIIAAMLASGLPNARPQQLIDVSMRDYAPAAIAANGVAATAREFEPITVRVFPQIPAGTTLNVVRGQGWSNITAIAAHERRYDVVITQTAVLQAPVFYYPGWRLEVNGVETPLRASQPNGWIEFTLPPAHTRCGLPLSTHLCARLPRVSPCSGVCCSCLFSCAMSGGKFAIADRIWEREIDTNNLSRFLYRPPAEPVVDREICNQGFLLRRLADDHCIKRLIVGCDGQTLHGLQLKCQTGDPCIGSGVAHFGDQTIVVALAVTQPMQPVKREHGHQHCINFMQRNLAPTVRLATAKHIGAKVFVIK